MSSLSTGAIVFALLAIADINALGFLYGIVALLLFLFQAGRDLSGWSRRG